MNKRIQAATENNKSLIVAEIAIGNLVSIKSCKNAGMLPVHYGKDPADDCPLVYYAGFSYNNIVAKIDVLHNALGYIR
jgi:hypothetical protein